MKYFSIILLCFLMSCNKAIFVSKSKIIHDQAGYLFYYQSDKCLFLPSIDTSIDNFLKDTSMKKGYFLRSVCGIEGLKHTAKKVYVDMAYQDEAGHRFVLSDSVFINATSLKYLPEKRSHVVFNDIIEFEYQGRIFRIDVSDDFYGNVLYVPGNTM